MSNGTVNFRPSKKNTQILVFIKQRCFGLQRDLFQAGLTLESKRHELESKTNKTTTQQNHENIITRSSHRQGALCTNVKAPCWTGTFTSPPLLSLDYRSAVSLHVPDSRVLGTDPSLTPILWKDQCCKEFQATF